MSVCEVHGFLALAHLSLARRFFFEASCLVGKILQRGEVLRPQCTTDTALGLLN